MNRYKNVRNKLAKKAAGTTNVPAAVASASMPSAPKTLRITVGFDQLLGNFTLSKVCTNEYLGHRLSPQYQQYPIYITS